MPDVHDLGGREGFGRIEVERGEPVFHAPWEGRVLGLAYLSIGLGCVNVDTFRRGIERMEPARYLASSYYERWLASLEAILAEAGVFAPGWRPPEVRQAPGFARAMPQAARFAIGARVRTRARAPACHTRLPGYASGKRGEVVAVRGGYVFPDTNAHGEGEQPQHLYAVRFGARELWGDAAEPHASVTLDLFEPYLDAEAHDGA